MTRVDADKYSVLIRSDYLYALSRLSRDRQERDELVQRAVESFLQDCTFERRRREIRIEEPRMRITSPLEHEPDYHMYLEFVRLPDELVELMDIANRHPNTNTPCYNSLGTVLNAAIRVYLEENHSEYLTDGVQGRDQSDAQPSC